jgi:hypothetical protein
VRLLELACNAHRAFARQPASEKRRLLKFVLSSSSWKNGRLTVEWQQPFDLIAETDFAATVEMTENESILAPHPEWRSQQNRHVTVDQAVRLAHLPKGTNWAPSAFCGVGSPKYPPLE